MLELMPPFYFLTFAKVSVSVSKTFGLEKNFRYQSRKHLVSKKVSVSVSKIENIWSKKKVSVSRILVSKKSLDIGLDGAIPSLNSLTPLSALFSRLLILRFTLSTTTWYQPSHSWGSWPLWHSRKFSCNSIWWNLRSRWQPRRLIYPSINRFDLLQALV